MHKPGGRLESGFELRQLEWAWPLTVKLRDKKYAPSRSSNALAAVKDMDALKSLDLEANTTRAFYVF